MRGQYTNWANFNTVAISKGMPPAIMGQLRRIFTTYCEGGCDLTTLRWFYTKWAPWAKIIPVRDDGFLDTQEEGYTRKRTPPIVLYESNLLEQGFLCEWKPDILWVYGDRGQGKSVFSYGMAERWLSAARTWRKSEIYGSPRVYVYGDVNGIVPSEPGWFRCPDWYVETREQEGFPLLEVYDEVPLALRSGGLSKAQKVWAEKLTRSRHCNIWTVMNMVQAKMAAKRGREMDALTLDRFSGLRQLRERLEDMPVRTFKDVYRRVIPEIRRMDAGLAMTQLNEDQGAPGTWLTYYTTKPPSWLEWREHERKEGSLQATAAPWPPEAVLQRATTYAQDILKQVMKDANDDDEDAKEKWRPMLGITPSPEKESQAQERIIRQILRGAGMEWAAIGEVIGGEEGAAREKMGGGGTLQRWGHRNKFENCSEKIQAAAALLKSELPTRNKSPVCWGLGLQVSEMI